MEMTKFKEWRNEKDMNIENGIWVAVSVKKNLGNYENVMFEGGASLVGVDPKDAKAWDELWNVVDEQISSKLKEIDPDGATQ